MLQRKVSKFSDTNINNRKVVQSCVPDVDQSEERQLQVQSYSPKKENHDCGEDSRSCPFNWLENILPVKFQCSGA
ncbi:unnamed protein product [Caretta caretta]